MPPIPPVTKAMREMTGRVRSRQASSCAASMTSASCFIACFPFSAFDGKRDSHAAADAKRREAPPRVSFLHFVKKRDQHPGARSADRMTERDRAAVHVHLLRVP